MNQMLKVIPARLLPQPCLTPPPAPTPTTMTYSLGDILKSPETSLIQNLEEKEC